MAKSQSAPSQTIDRRAWTTPVAYGPRTILVGPRHLIEINMERVARAVYSDQSPPPVQRRSDKK